jgi:hydroxymethylbilane synthase
VVASPDGSRVIRGELSGDHPVQVGTALAQDLLSRGAREILSEVYTS